VNHQRLTLDDVVKGLEEFAGAYEALDVFADDLEELQGGRPVEGLTQADLLGRTFVLDRAGRKYRLEVFPTEGFVRLSRAPTAPTTGEAAAIGALAGAGLGAVASAKRKKGEGAALGLVLGLLVGATLGARPDAPRRVFTMAFDPFHRTWGAYDGGLVRWMKQELLPATG